MAKRKMRKGGGGAKGSAFERRACRRISLWVTKGERDDVFWRSSISGGRATVALKKGQSMAHIAGDICALREEGYDFAGRWFVELKNYRNLQVERFVLERRGKLWDFWVEAQVQAMKYGKTPMMVLKQNYLKEFMLVNEYGWEQMHSTKLLPMVVPTLAIVLVPGRLRLLSFDVVTESYKPTRTKPKGRP